MPTWKKTLLGLAGLYILGAAFIAFPTVDGAQVEPPPAISPPPSVRSLPQAQGEPYYYRQMGMAAAMVVLAGVGLTVVVRSQTRPRKADA